MSFKSMLGAVLLGAMLTEVNSQQLFKLVPVGPNNYGDLNPYGNQGGIAFGNGNGNGVPGYFVGQQLNGNKNNLGSYVQGRVVADGKTAVEALHRLFASYACSEEYEAVEVAQFHSNEPRVFVPDEARYETRFLENTDPALRLNP